MKKKKKRSDRFIRGYGTVHMGFRDVIRDVSPFRRGKLLPSHPTFLSSFIIADDDSLHFQW